MVNDRLIRNGPFVPEEVGICELSEMPNCTTYSGWTRKMQLLAVKTGSDKLVKTVDRKWRPITDRFKGELAFGGRLQQPWKVSGAMTCRMEVSGICWQRNGADCHT